MEALFPMAGATLDIPGLPRDGTRESSPSDDLANALGNGFAGNGFHLAGF
jgi:hypothetical protein